MDCGRKHYKAPTSPKEAAAGWIKEIRAGNGPHVLRLAARPGSAVKLHGFRVYRPSLAETRAP